MKLIDYLTLKDISQAAFARILKDSPQNISRYVAGRKPDDEKMQAIIDATGGLVQPNDFYDVVLPRSTSKQTPTLNG
jgi:transcriptional regulator with XRE-family HTH domain